MLQSTERSKVGMADEGQVPAIALASIAAVNSALSLYFMERASIRVPVFDMLEWLRFYGDRAAAGDWFGYLWSPHNEHHIVITRILLALDVRWFGGEGTAFVVFGLLALFGMIVATCREIAKSNLSSSCKLAAAAIAVLLLTPAHVVVTIGMPVLSPYLQTSAFALFSFALLDGAADADSFSNYRRAAAIVCGWLTAFGVVAGLVIWPALIWSAWRGKLGWTWIAAFAGAGILFTALYLRHLAFYSVSITFSFSQLALSLDYGIRFLALPWSHMPELVWPARFIGLGVLCLACFAFLKDGLSARPVGRLQRLGLGLVVFSLFVAGAAALARAQVAQEREMPIRYGALVALFYLGLLLWSLHLLERHWNAPGGLRLRWLLVGTATVWLAQQIVVGTYAAGEASRRNDAWARFVAGEWTPDMMQYVFPNREHAEEILADLRRMHVYVGK